MFTKIYLTIAVVLRCYKKCSNFLWYFDVNSPVYFDDNSPMSICNGICFCGALSAR